MQPTRTWWPQLSIINAAEILGQTQAPTSGHSCNRSANTTPRRTSLQSCNPRSTITRYAWAPTAYPIQIYRNKATTHCRTRQYAHKHMYASSWQSPNTIFLSNLGENRPKNNDLASRIDTHASRWAKIHKGYTHISITKSSLHPSIYHQLTHIRRKEPW